MTPLVAIVIITTLITLLTTIGIPALNALLWTLYTRLSPSAAAQLRANAKLRQEVLTLKKELLSTSSQDQFAKWAKIRRNLDKKTAELQKSRTLPRIPPSPSRPPLPSPTAGRTRQG